MSVKVKTNRFITQKKLKNARDCMHMCCVQNGTKMNVFSVKDLIQCIC